MPAGSKPGERRGGRQKGTPNKATADIKAAFQSHGDALVKALIDLTKSDDERVRLGAIQTCLDRGWGKALQESAVSGDLIVQVVRFGDGPEASEQDASG